MKDTKDFDSASGQDASVTAPADQLTSQRKLDAILRIPVTTQVVLGTATMPVSALMKLGSGATIRLDRRVGEAVDIVVNGRLVARGEVVVIEDENPRLGVTLTEVLGAIAS